MEQQDIIAKAKAVSEQIMGTLERKNKDYGNSFSNLYEKIGMPYAYGHMAEKLERVWSLMNSPAHVNESLEDSLLDLAGYTILTLALIRKSN